MPKGIGAGLTIFQMNSNPTKLLKGLERTGQATFLTLASQALHFQRIEQQVGVISITHNSDRTLSHLRDLYLHLKRQDNEVFVLEQKGNGLARILCANSHIKKLVLLACDDHAKLAVDYPHYEFSPIYRLLLKFLSFIPPGPDSLKSYLETSIAIEVATTICKFINRVVGAFCKALRRTWMKKAQESFERSASDNFEGLLKNIDAIATRYRAGAVTLRLATFLREGGPGQLLAARSRLHAWLRKRFGADLLLYAWTLEYGRETGMHHHYLIILKPQGNEDHVDVVEEIGNKWSTITLGLGWIYNGNEHCRKQRYQALGLVRLDAPNVITGLQLIASYLTLAGVYVKLRLPGVAKAFDKGGSMGGNPTRLRKVGRRPKRSPGARIAISAAQGRAGYVNFM
jgi:hypothetical protein